MLFTDVENVMNRYMTVMTWIHCTFNDFHIM